MSRHICSSLQFASGHAAWGRWLGVASWEGLVLLARGCLKTLTRGTHQGLQSAPAGHPKACVGCAAPGQPRNASEQVSLKTSLQKQEDPYKSKRRTIKLTRVSRMRQQGIQKRALVVRCARSKAVAKGMRPAVVRQPGSLPKPGRRALSVRVVYGVVCVLLLQAEGGSKPP